MQHINGMAIREIVNYLGKALKITIRIILATDYLYFML